MSQAARQFEQDAARVAADAPLRAFLQRTLLKYQETRAKQQASFQDWPAARQAAAEAKWEAINHLDQYLEQFEANLIRRGAQVHWARHGEEARAIILDLLRQRRARTIIKSKSMATEEIHLNDALAAAGFEVIESDLGEYICQLKQEPPYHLVFPAMHLSREQISDLFHAKLGSERTSNPEELTLVARRVLRQKYVQADAGITGANFAVAETGMISITENEGNARLTAALPRLMITLVGIEKVLPRFDDLALLLPMLATAGTGQPLTCYNSQYSGRRQPGECDGPEEFHVILLDNHRTALLADAEQRDALHCIRCGACLNICPIFRNVGGHTYGTTYGGPIGSVITPHLRGLVEWKHLSSASSLCGACSETCPVKIDIHHHLLHNRRNAQERHPAGWERTAFRLFAWVANSPSLWQFVLELARFFDPLVRRLRGTRLDPLRPWTATRDLPAPAPESFKEWWRRRA
ncbi:MAG TPA: LutB/LldF family L-lactate oxidation iron-sulfur protein [Methylomirabilota bacterium]|nr:LutB/LldF family L-lactate oxidation iron-sulfur protein [Methylomirabilota bacterium]